MVSQIHTFSLNRLRVPQRLFLPMLVLIGLLAAGLAGAPWHTLLILCFVYLGSFPFSYRSYKKLQIQAEAERLEVNQTEVDEMIEEDSSGTHLREV